ncbi:MAG TPA: PilN domain-containing protein [Pseudolabrys sp.]
MNFNDLAGAFWNWMDCVATTVGGGIDSIRRSRQVRLTEEEAGTFRVDLLAADKDAGAAVDRIRIVDGAIAGQLPAQIAAALAGSRAELVLQPSRFLFRPLDLPKRAGEFIDGIVRSQIDRLTPWSVADAAFGWTPPRDAAKDRIALTVVATARTRVAPYVQALLNVGAASISVSAVPKAGGSPVEVLHQRGAGAVDADSVRRVLTTVLAAAALSMGLAVVTDQIVGAGLDAETSDLLRRAAERRAVISRDGGVAGMTQPQIALERRKRETPSSVIVLEALSQTLPDHTYATELRVEGNKLQVVGVTHDAPSLIRLIEQSPHFTRATFFAPTTRSPNDPGERFHIEARIKPGFSVQR